MVSWTQQNWLGPLGRSCTKLHPLPGCAQLEAQTRLQTTNSILQDRLDSKEREIVDGKNAYQTKVDAMKMVQ